MSKDNVVGCFYSGSAQSAGPDFTITRETAREWKDEGKGYFCCHGQSFQLLTPVSEKELLGHGNLIPFGSPSQNKMRKPHPISYPIPAVADHRMRWFNSFMLPEPMKAECY